MSGDLTKRDNVMVFVRTRPLNAREQKCNAREGWAVADNCITQTDMSKSQGQRPQKFTFDKVFTKVRVCCWCAVIGLRVRVHLAGAL